MVLELPAVQGPGIGEGIVAELGGNGRLLYSGRINFVAFPPAEGERASPPS
jgi:hypothetical protein